MALHYCRWHPQTKMINPLLQGHRRWRVRELPLPSKAIRDRGGGLGGATSTRTTAPQAVVRALDYQTHGFDKFVIANTNNVMAPKVFPTGTLGSPLPVATSVA